MASSEEIALEYFNRGVQGLSSHNVEESLDNLKMAEAIFAELDNEEYYVKTLGYLCIVYGMLNYITPMLQTLLQGVSYCDKHKLRGAKHVFYSTVCDKYMTLKDYKKGANYGLMAVHDIESNVTLVNDKPSTFVVAYLNLAICYVKIHRLKEAEIYLYKAQAISEKNQLHAHDLTMAIIKAMLYSADNDSSYILEHKEELLSFYKDFELTVVDYIQDISLLVELFCSFQLYDEAATLIDRIERAAAIRDNPKLILEASKLEMQIQKSSGNIDAYHAACVRYAENEILYNARNMQNQLEEFDTAIALSIADTPSELL